MTTEPRSATPVNEVDIPLEREPECRLVVHLNSTPGAEAAKGREYFRYRDTPE